MLTLLALLLLLPDLFQWCTENPDRVFWITRTLFLVFNEWRKVRRKWRRNKIKGTTATTQMVPSEKEQSVL